MSKSAGVSIAVNPDESSASARVIFLGVPTFGTVSIRWHAHLMQVQNPLNRSVFHAYAMGYEVGQARNYLVTQALAWRNGSGHTASHVFFVDDDCLVPPYALTRLLSHQRPIVSGLYYAKTETPQPLVLDSPLGGVVTDLPRNTVLECYAHGMGCTLIELRVFRELLDASLVGSIDTPNGPLPQWFSTTRDELTQGPGAAPVYRNQTEDVFFLERAAQLGYRAAVDTGVFAFHWDEQTRRGFPLHLWEEYQRTGNVTIGREVGA